jgi:hypothetical protein
VTTLSSSTFKAGTLTATTVTDTNLTVNTSFNLGITSCDTGTSPLAANVSAPGIGTTDIILMGSYKRFSAGLVISSGQVLASAITINAANTISQTTCASNCMIDIIYLNN